MTKARVGLGLIVLVAVVAVGLSPSPVSAKPEAGLLVVGFAPGVDHGRAHSRVNRDSEARVVDVSQQLDADLVEVADVSKARSVYQGVPGVRYADPPVSFSLDHTPTVIGGPTDPLALAQYNLARIGAFDAYQSLYGGEHPYFEVPFAGTPIAIVDSGVDMTHPDLLPPKLDPLRCVSFLPWPFTRPAQPPVTAPIPGCEDTLSHGTHVAGSAAAWTDNANGMAAPAVSSPIIAVKSFWSAVAFDWEISKGIAYAADAGAKVISMSFGSDEPSKLMSSAVAYAEAKDAVTVAAAGNDGDRTRQWPACESDLAVGATRFAGRERASFSSYGCVNIAAPGELVVSTLPGGTYGPLDGTSMATPQVAGAIAMLRSLGASRSTAVNAVLATAQPAGANVGKGELDFHAAVHKVQR